MMKEARFLGRQLRQLGKRQRALEPGPDKLDCALGRSGHDRMGIPLSLLAARPDKHTSADLARRHCLGSSMAEE